LAFAGTLRKGEILALTWEDVDFKNKSIQVNKTLSRVSRNTLVEVGHRDVIYQFPPVLSAEKTVVVLKRPKTNSSICTVYLPEYVMNELLDLKRSQEETEYPNLVFQCFGGRPLLECALSNRFRDLLKNIGLVHVTFHSLRHSSITYKLILSHGNIKAVQGDSGHAQAEMVTELYGHILDEKRRETAALFQEEFYQDID
jgi:integrase